MTRHQQWTHYFALIWLLFMSFYWLILFDNDLTRTEALVAFGVSFSLLIGYTWSFFYLKKQVRKLMIVGFFCTTIIFSIIAYFIQPPCKCYHVSVIDYIPNLITLLVLTIVALSERKQQTTR